MKLESVGILVALRPFDEKNAVAHIFTREHGMMTGMLRGANVAKANRPLVGQIGVCSWNARLDSALGVFHWESEKNIAAPLMTDAHKLAYMNSVFDLVCTMLPERESYPTLYNKTVELLNALPRVNDATDEYTNWEICLIGELGYALDLTHCSGCGKTTDLHYISPKTARAVCDSCAAPYVSRLYKMPITLDTTLKFLEKVCVEQGAKLPNSRKLLTIKKN